MASIPTNPTQLTPPRVPVMDERTGAISREWYRFFLSLLTATQANTDTVDTAPDSESLVASLSQIVATVQNELQTLPNADISSIQNQLNELQDTFGITPPTLLGSVTSVDASGGSTGLTFTGGPITTSGTLTLGGTLAVAYGGTGQTSYTNGQLLIGNTTGNTLTPATLTAGTNVTISNGAGAITINATDAFVGTVTSVSVVSANGFAGTVATATTTPAITVSTTVTGVIKGNGTAISAATAGTDYVAPGAYTTSGLTMATSRLLGRTTASTGAAEEISVAGGLTLSGGVLTGASGSVTSVTGTSPVVSSGGTTPAISMPAATTSVNGYLTSTDWTTFNNKGSGSVTSVSFTGGVVSVATATTTPALTVAGTSGGIVYFSSGTTWATSAALAASAIVLGGGAGAAPATTTTGTGVVTALGVNTGTAGAFVVNGGALGTPSSGTVTNLTGTASININGTVGATTASTGAFTTITGSTSLTTPLQSGGTAAASTLTLQSTSGAGTTDAIIFKTASQTERMRIDSAGNVGIGVASLFSGYNAVGYNLNLSNASTVLWLNASGTWNTTTAGGAITYFNDNNLYIDAKDSASNMIFRVNGATERARINSTGNVLINETSPSAASLNHNFEVNGDIMSTGSASGLFWANRSTAPSLSANWYGWYTTGGTIFLYNPAVGNIASINAATGVYAPLSDRAKKKDFEPSAIGLDAIMALKPTLFRMQTDAEDAPKQLGFIAQDVKDCIPQAYVEEPNTDAGGNDATYIGLNDRPIIAALVKAVQELKVELDALKGRFTV